MQRCVNGEAIIMGKYCKPKRYVFNTADARFFYGLGIDEYGHDGFYLGDGYIELSVYNKNLVDNEKFYVHEFSEMAILGAIRKCTRKWHGTVKYKGFAATNVAHLVAPYGHPNKRTLHPDVNPRKLYISVCSKLSTEELKIRKQMGFDW